MTVALAVALAAAMEFRGAEHATNMTLLRLVLIEARESLRHKRVAFHHLM